MNIAKKISNFWASEAREKLRKRLVTYGGLFFVVYLILGFWIIPYIVQAKLPDLIDSELGWKAEVQNVSMNPLTLSASLEGLSLMPNKEDKLLSMGNVYVNVQVSSVFRWALTFKKIIVEDLDLHLILDEGGQLTFLDYLPTSTSDSSPSGDIPRVLLQRMEINEGHLSFEDRSRSTVLKKKLRLLDFYFENLSTLPDDDAPLAIVARTEDSEEFRWTGDLSLNPIASKGTVVVSGLQANNISPYLPEESVFTVSDGNVNVRVNYDVRYHDGSISFLMQDSSVGLDGITLVESWSGETVEEEKYTSKPFSLEIGIDEVRLDKLKFDEKKKSTVRIALHQQDGGRFSLEGQLGVNPVAANAEFELQDWSLQPFESVLNQFVALLVERGRVSGSGRFDISQDESEWQVGAKGSLQVVNLSLLDGIRQEKLASFQEFRVDRADFSLQERKIHMEDLAIEKPEIVLTVARDGTTSAEEVVAERGGKEKILRLLSDYIEWIKSFNVDSTLIEINEAVARVENNALRPSVKTVASNVNLELKGFSTLPDAPAQLKLNGQINEFGTFSVKGPVEISRQDVSVNWKARSENIGMKEFSPYLAQFLGYKVESGKLNTLTDIQISQNQLKTKTDLALKSFNLGGAVESESAIDAPVKLGVALLKDTSGDITLDIPLDGRLDNPKFEIASAIQSVVSQAIVKAATSPFTLLARAIGSDNDKGLDYVGFKPGSALLEPPEREKLVKLSSALDQKPQIQLNIFGGASKEIDQKGLAKKQILKKLSETVETYDDLNEAEKKRLISRYEWEFDRDAEDLLKDPDAKKKLTDEEYHDQLARLALADWVTRIQVSPGEIESLAKRRLQEIRRYITEEARPSLSRIAFQDAVVHEDEVEGTVPSRLTLTTIE